MVKLKRKINLTKGTKNNNKKNFVKEDKQCSLILNPLNTKRINRVIKRTKELVRINPSWHDKHVTQRIRSKLTRVNLSNPQLRS